MEWTGKEFSLIDTGGWVVNSEDVFEEEINKQVKVAIEEADVILFVVDVLNGITDLDMEVAQILRRCKRPVIVVANLGGVLLVWLGRSFLHLGHQWFLYRGFAG